MLKSTYAYTSSFNFLQVPKKKMKTYRITVWNISFIVIGHKLFLDKNCRLFSKKERFFSKNKFLKTKMVNYLDNLEKSVNFFVFIGRCLNSTYSLECFNEIYKGKIYREITNDDIEIIYNCIGDDFSVINDDDISFLVKKVADTRLRLKYILERFY